MYEYLVSREQDEMFRTSARTIKFPDGAQHRIEAYRLIWAWYDRALSYTYARDEEAILNMVLRCAEHEKCTLGEALGKVLEYTIREDEAAGMDYTDDDLELHVAKQAMERFHERKRNGTTRKRSMKVKKDQT